MEPGRKRAPYREANAIVDRGAGTGTGASVGTGVSDIAIGVRWRGWVRLGGHDPGNRREGRVGILADGQLLLVLFVHADVGWGNEGDFWTGEGSGNGGRKIERGEGVLNGHGKKVAWPIARAKANEKVEKSPSSAIVHTRRRPHPLPDPNKVLSSGLARTPTSPPPLRALPIRENFVGACL